MENKLQITKENIGDRLDKFLVEKMPTVSRQKIQKWIKTGYIQVNGQFQKANYKCKQGDEVSYLIPDEPKREIKAQAFDLELIYEDELLAVINKPKGLIVHPTHSQTSDTLVNYLMHQFDSLSSINGAERPGIVHRLDKDTSGLLIIAKTDEAHLALQKQFIDQSVYREYEALTFGVFNHDTGIINAPIGRDPKDRLKRAVVETGKAAETHFTVLKRFKQHTHVKCELKTGRTHQIRVHLKYINHPIIGDPLYVRKKSKLLDSQALFAKKISFKHPTSGEMMTFEIERPSYFTNLLQSLERIS